MTVILPSSLLPLLRAGKSLPDDAELITLLDQLRQSLTSGSLDNYERTYTASWLTRLFTLCQDDNILDEAGLLLAMTTGKPDTPRPNEVFTFETPNGPLQITIKESFMQDVHATGFRTWSSAVHLSKRLLGNPRAFFPKISFEGTQVLRVLELGSGTGLAGIAAYRALEQASIPTCITLSDMDDSTLSTLRKNIADNGISFEGGCKKKICVTHLDWTAIDIDNYGSFDVILGADIVYEPEHAQLIHGVVSKLLRQKPISIFHLMVVLRPTHESDIKALEQVFRSRPNDVDAGYLNITHCDTIEATEKDDYPYPHRYYKIQWHNPKPV